MGSAPADQLDLFATSHRGRLVPRLPAATADPQTSHDAARELVRSGRITAQQAETLASLRAWQGDPPTSAELAGGDLRLRYQHARRLCELERAGSVVRLEARVCRVSGARAHTWGLA